MKNVLSFEAAIKKIGKQEGKNKMDNAMGGAFFPVGTVSVEWVLATIYNENQKSIEKRLYALCDKQFKQERNDHVKRWRKKHRG